jgi:hypothetical protein
MPVNDYASPADWIIYALGRSIERFPGFGGLAGDHLA